MSASAVHPRILARFEAVKRQRAVEAAIVRARDELAELIDQLSRLETADPQRQALIALAIEGLHQAITALHRADPRQPSPPGDLAMLAAALRDLGRALHGALKEMTATAGSDRLTARSGGE